MLPYLHVLTFSCRQAKLILISYVRTRIFFSKTEKKNLRIRVDEAWLFRSLRATRNNRIIVTPCLLALPSFLSSYAPQKTSVVIAYATLHYYKVKFLTIKFMTDVNTDTSFRIHLQDISLIFDNFNEWEESHWSLKVRIYFWRDVFVTVLSLLLKFADKLIRKHEIRPRSTPCFL